MARVWIGNFKGPKGDKGDKGDIGPQGPKGEQGPMGLVNAEAAIEFEDYTTEGAEIPTPEEALAEMVSGKSLKGIISNIRAFFKGVVTLGMIVNNLEDVLNVEEGTVLPVGCKALQDLNVKMGGIVSNITIPFVSTGNDTISIYKNGSMITVRNIYFGVRSRNPTAIILKGEEYLIIAKANNNNSFNLQQNEVFTLLYGYAINTQNQIVKLYTIFIGYDGTSTYLLTKQGLTTDQLLILVPISASIGYRS